MAGSVNFQWISTEKQRPTGQKSNGKGGQHMAQPWESKAIREAGKRWTEAYQKGDRRGMEKALAEAAQIRRQEGGYTLDGGSMTSKPTVTDKSKFTGQKTGGTLFRNWGEDSGRALQSLQACGGSAGGI